VREQLVHGSGWIEAKLPEDTELLSPGITLPLPPAPDLGNAVRDALERPLDGPPLRRLARGASRVVVAFDDRTVPR
jgi:hypothetical protein